MLRVRDDLRTAGYNVWMDVDHMTGSCLEAMAKAVEGADTVVIALTAKYKESHACRTEAEYAYGLNKRIVPLMVQGGYKPDGWLGAMLGTKLWFDFTTEERIQPSLEQLRRELGRGDAQQEASAAPVHAEPAGPSSGRRTHAHGAIVQRPSAQQTQAAVTAVHASTAVQDEQGQEQEQGGVSAAQWRMQERLDVLQEELRQSRAQLRHLTAEAEEHERAAGSASYEASLRVVGEPWAARAARRRRLGRRSLVRRRPPKRHHHNLPTRSPR